jgi:hypothetical protein
LINDFKVSLQLHARNVAFFNFMVQGPSWDANSHSAVQEIPSFL